MYKLRIVEVIQMITSINYLKPYNYLNWHWLTYKNNQPTNKL